MTIQIFECMVTHKSVILRKPRGFAATLNCFYLRCHQHHQHGFRMFGTKALRYLMGIASWLISKRTEMRFCQQHDGQ